MNVLINMAGTHEYYWSEIGKSLEETAAAKIRAPGQLWEKTK